MALVSLRARMIKSPMSGQYQRLCPNCGRVLVYRSRASLSNAKRRNRNCAHCAQSERCSRPEELELRRKRTPKKFGSDNHFFGKRHKKETILQLQATGREAAQRRKESKSLREWWSDKYTSEEVEQKIEQWKAKLSAASKGECNPMYGKPAPNGSGNGWSGWYKNWFFRSLHELSYVVLELEPNNINWCSAERKDFAIKYFDLTGVSRTYFADFFLESKILVECKPKRLHGAPRVKLKQQAALDFCKHRGWSYSLVDPPLLTTEKLAQMHEANVIRFTDKYEKKYAQFLQML